MKAHFKILAVDDQEYIIEVLKYILSDFSDVQTALNGEEALRIAYSHQIDLIVSDINMRPMTGIEFGYKVRKTLPSIPIIFFSGEVNGETIYKRDIDLIGNSQFVEKDFRKLKEAAINLKNTETRH